MSPVYFIQVRCQLISCIDRPGVRCLRRSNDFWGARSFLWYENRKVWESFMIVQAFRPLLPEHWHRCSLSRCSLRAQCCKKTSMASIAMTAAKKKEKLDICWVDMRKDADMSDWKCFRTSNMCHSQSRCSHAVCHLCPATLNPVKIPHRGDKFSVEGDLLTEILELIE